MNLYRFEGTVQNQVDPLGLFAPVLAAPWLLEALAYTTTAMTGILVGVGIMDAMEESEDNVDGTIHDKHHGMPPFGKDDRDFLFCYGRKGV